MACVDWPPLLSEIYRDENQTFSSVNSAWIHYVVLITRPCYWHLLYIVFHKRETPYSWCCLCQILTDFHNSVTGWFPCKFAVKRLLKIATRLAYVATLPCERLMSLNKRLAIFYKEVCGGVELRSVYCKICLRFFLNRWIFGKVTYKKEGGCLVHLATTLLQVEENAWHNPPFTRNYSIFAKCILILIFLTGRLSNKPFLIWLFKIPLQLKYVINVLSNLSLITALLNEHVRTQVLTPQCPH